MRRHRQGASTTTTSAQADISPLPFSVFRACSSRSTPRRLLLSHLPAELLEGVCSHLDDADDLKATSLVCRALRIESQKRLFRSVHLELAHSSDRQDRAEQLKATQRLQDKIEATLALPVGIRSLMISVRSDMPRNPRFLAVDAPKRFAMLSQYLTQAQSNIDTLSLNLDEREKGWSTPIIALLSASRHVPARLDITVCPGVEYPIKMLGNLLANWPTCNAFAVHLRHPEPIEYNAFWDPWHWGVPMDPDYASFLARAQSQLGKACFSAEARIWNRLVSAPFVANLRSLQFEADCCNGFSAPFKDAVAAGLDIMIEEMEISWGKEIVGDGPINSVVFEILGACSRLKRLHLESEFTEDGLDFTLLPPSLESIRIIDKSTDGYECSTVLQGMIDWLCDHDASPRLKAVELYIAWDLEEADLRSYAADFNLANSECRDYDLEELSVRYPWDANSPLEDPQDV